MRRDIRDGSLDWRSWEASPPTNRRSGFPARPRIKKGERAYYSGEAGKLRLLPIGGRASQPDQ
ncbi:MAG: hypothetical protein IJR26_06850 [Bacteroidales bacterium]|nr:hypothetical protein [Bacteroidales bacterium]